MKTKRGIIFVVGGVLVVSLLFVFYFPLALDPGNGGGGTLPPFDDPDPFDDSDDSIGPDPPTINQICPDPDPDGSITVSWTEPVGTIGFRLYRSKNGSVYNPLIQTSLNQYTDSNLDNGDYSYKVKAYNFDGDSDYSNIVSVTVDIPQVEPPPPPIPTEPEPELEPEPNGIPPVYYLLLIGGLGIGSFLVYKKTREIKK